MTHCIKGCEHRLGNAWKCGPIIVLILGILASAAAYSGEKEISKEEAARLFEEARGLVAKAAKTRDEIRKSLALEVEINEPFIVGEPVIVTLVLHNTSKKAIEIPKSIQRDVRYMRPKRVPGEVSFSDDAEDIEVELYEGTKITPGGMVAYLVKDQPVDPEDAWVRDIPKSLPPNGRLRRVITLYCPDPFDAEKLLVVASVPPLEDAKRIFMAAKTRVLAGTDITRTLDGYRYQAWISKHEGRSYLFAKAIPEQALKTWLSEQVDTTKLSNLQKSAGFFRSYTDPFGGPGIQKNREERADEPSPANKPESHLHHTPVASNHGVYNRRIAASDKPIQILAMSAEKTRGEMVVLYIVGTECSLALVRPFTGQIQHRELGQRGAEDLSAKTMTVTWSGTKKESTKVALGEKDKRMKVTFESFSDPNVSHCTWEMEPKGKSNRPSEIENETSDLPSKTTQPQSGSEGIEVENGSSPGVGVAPEEGAAGVEEQPHSAE